MSKIRIDSHLIRENIETLDKHFRKHKKKWTLVTKVLAGNKHVLRSILDKKSIKKLHSVADSRLSGLKTVKQINPEITTMLIKPPSKYQIANVIKYADISLNTSLKMIKALNEEAYKAQKIHRIIIMIELGELREGILKENTVKFYSQVTQLPNIEVLGIGTNLGCMYGVEPDHDKLMQLSLYKKIIDLKFGIDIPVISGGSSITLPLLREGVVPQSINHFRVGEAAFLGTSPFDGKRFGDLHENAFTLLANIIEIEKKPAKPDGNIGNGNIGHVNTKIEESDEHHYRAIVDFGVLDVNPETDVVPVDSEIKFIGTTSDMTVFDLGLNRKNLKVGDTIEFQPNYMGVARLMLSKYVKKEVDTGVY